MSNFAAFGLHDDLNASLLKMEYKQPTPIQEKAIPLAMKGRDILGSAQTGTGKTAAFSIPMIEMLLRDPRAGALILTPTRELARQVLDVVHQLLGFKSPIKTAFIIGGEPMGKQLSQLRARPRIIVGTPGRVNDHLERGSIMLGNTNFLVLDETDRMLDMGFGVQLDKIVTYLPKKRQTLMFSATMPKAIEKLSGKYLTDPTRISTGATNTIAKNIEQIVVKIEQPEKYKELVNQIHDRKGSVIVFVKTKHGADKMAKKLNNDGFQADALHGDLRQGKRNMVMSDFRRKKFKILVATDIAARGLDVPHIEHVVNFDLPQVAEDYIHRMGRTARAGAEGAAVSFVASQDSRKWHAIELLLNPDLKKTSSDKSRSGKPGAKRRFGKPGAGKAHAGKSNFGKPKSRNRNFKNKPRSNGSKAA